jgi:hypothetical protein
MPALPASAHYGSAQKDDDRPEVIMARGESREPDFRAEWRRRESNPRKISIVPTSLTCV